jgi:phenylacetate-coenzyme A ligase PaaK-like adenylate-forming protein
MPSARSEIRTLAKEVLSPFYYRLPMRVWAPRLYWETRQLLRESQWWDEGRLREYQMAELRRMLRHCAANVPYYRRLFRCVGFDPEAVRGVTDLQGLPLLDRETLCASPQDFLAENVKPWRRAYYTTGGTMGRPLGLYGLKDGGWRERAFMDLLWERVGYTRQHLRAMLRGSVIHRRECWKFDAKEHAFLFSNFHMTGENASAYAQVMKRYRIPYLHSYPSAVMDFARHLKDQGIEPPRFRAILVSSENLYPGQREFMQSFFGCRVFSWFGHSENTVLAGECERTSCYHIFPEYGVVEIVREDAKLAEQEGEEGELVGTSLYNRAMPLVRYRTGDWAVVGPQRCPCGRRYPLLGETRGRWLQEMLVGKLDNLISMTALNMHSGVFDRVQQFQFYQQEKGRVDLRIVPKPEYSERDSTAILRALQAKMGDTMNIELKFTDRIPLTARGKFRFIIQELQLPKSEFGTPDERSL